MNKSVKTIWKWCGTEWCVILFALIWLGLVIAGPGYFPRHIDDIYYKEPGYNWAMQRGFISPALKGYGGASPSYDVVFAGYPPLYPFGYGVWLQAFPHSLRSAIAFDSAIRFLLVIWCLFGLPKLLPGLSRHGVALTAAIVAMLGTWGRPDELAMVFGLWGLTFWLAGRRWMSALAGGALLALCLSTSWPAFIVFCAWSAPVWLHMWLRAPRKWSVVSRFVLGVLGCWILGLSILVPYYFRAGAIAQLNSEPGQLMAGIIWSFRQGTLKPYFELCWAAIRTDVFMVPLYLTLCAFAVFIAMKADAYYRACLAGVALGYLLVAIGMPNQGYYFWFLFPILLLIVVEHLHPCRKCMLVLVAVLVLAINPRVRDCLKGFTLPEDQTLAYSQRIIREYVPTAASVLTDVRSYYVMRAQYESLYVTDGSDSLQEIIGSVQYCVFSFYHLGQYSGTAMPDTWTCDVRAKYLMDHFEVVYDGLSSRLPSWSGVPLGITPVGYGIVVYKRRN